MAEVKAKPKVLIAIVLNESGVSSIRLGSTDEQSTEHAYEMLARLTPQIRSLDAAARLVEL